MDGGGTGMEYFFAFASDPDTQDVYIGGTSRSEIMEFGNVKRMNAMYDEDQSSHNPVCSSKAFFVKLKSELELPYCVSSCDASGMAVVEGHCYIDVRRTVALEPHTSRLRHTSRLLCRA